MGFIGITCFAKGRVIKVNHAPRSAKARDVVVFAHRTLGGCVARVLAGSLWALAYPLLARVL